MKDAEIRYMKNLLYLFNFTKQHTIGHLYKFKKNGNL